jgi:iron complex transport system permease protein
VTTIRSRVVAVVSVFGALLLLVIVIAPLVGSTPISIVRVFDRTIPFADNVDAQIFFVARLPRILAAVFVGGALAAAGVVFQALFRNPLATPDTLGVSSGAALGAVVAITFHLDFSVGGYSSIPLASLAGSFGALGIVYALAAARRRGLSTTVLLLAGVTMTAFFSALIMFTQYLADFTDTFRMVRWLMGMLDVGGYAAIVAVVPLLLVAFVWFATLPRALDLLSLGSDMAAARGVDVLRAERAALVSASLATGAAVSISGPVGFVGIIVPHMVRLMVGADHRLVLPASALFGASFLVICDLVARTLFSPIEVPVGVVTAIIGGPFFLWLLLRRA